MCVAVFESHYSKAKENLSEYVSLLQVESESSNLRPALHQPQAAGGSFPNFHAKKSPRSQV